MRKTNVLAIPRRSLPVSDVSIPDADLSYPFEIRLRCAGISGNMRGVELTRSLCEKYLPGPNGPAPVSFPPCITGQVVDLSETLFANAAGIYVMQVVEEDEDRYSLEELAMLADAAPRVWMGLIAKAHALNQEQDRLLEQEEKKEAGGSIALDSAPAISSSIPNISSVPISPLPDSLTPPPTPSES